MGSGRIRQECEADKSVRQYPGDPKRPETKNPSNLFSGNGTATESGKRFEDFLGVSVP